MRSHSSEDLKKRLNLERVRTLTFSGFRVKSVEFIEPVLLNVLGFHYWLGFHDSNSDSFCNTVIQILYCRIPKIMGITNFHKFTQVSFSYETQIRFSNSISLRSQGNLKEISAWESASFGYRISLRFSKKFSQGFSHEYLKVFNIIFLKYLMACFIKIYNSILFKKFASIIKNMYLFIKIYVIIID